MKSYKTFLERFARGKIYLFTKYNNNKVKF
jgi:hypothetical protein